MATVIYSNQAYVLAAKSVRAVAASVLKSLLQQQGSLASLLPTAEQSTAEKDRALLKELCFGCCRWHPLLHTIAEGLLRRPLKNKDADIQALLLIGLYQLQFMRTPSHAAINECVNTAAQIKKPWAKKLINGVLRNFQREQEKLYKDAFEKKPSIHPGWLQKAINKSWPDQADGIFAANNKQAPMSLRVNLSKNSRQDYLAKLDKVGISATASTLTTAGVILNKPTPVNEIPGFNAGLVSVQDEAAQLSASLLELKPGLRVLDACCAPGGKTCHIAESENRLAELVAVDSEERRLQKVHDNLQRLCLQAKVIVGNATNPHQWWDGQCFDRILVDAPCSATGVIRRQPDIKLLRQADDINELCQLQLAILQSLWPLLREEGILLYATCSILPRENSKLIERFLQHQTNAEHNPIDATWGLAQAYGRQLLPGKDQTSDHDGFFYAKIKKVSLKTQDPETS